MAEKVKAKDVTILVDFGEDGGGLVPVSRGGGRMGEVTGELVEKSREAIDKAQERAGFSLISGDTLVNLQQRISGFLPSLVNDTANLITNLAILLFLLYYMLVDGKIIESYLSQILPLKHNNIDLLAAETKRLVMHFVRDVDHKIFQSYSLALDDGA